MDFDLFPTRNTSTQWWILHYLGWQNNWAVTITAYFYRGQLFVGGLNTNHPFVLGIWSAGDRNPKQNYAVLSAELDGTEINFVLGAISSIIYLHSQKKNKHSGLTPTILLNMQNPGKTQPSWKLKPLNSQPHYKGCMDFCSGKTTCDHGNLRVPLQGNTTVIRPY